MTVSHQELGRFIRELLIAHGAGASDATIVAEGLVWSNLRGGDGHGVSRLPRYLKMLEKGEIDVKAKPHLIHDRAATFVLEAGHGFGPVAAMQGAAIAVERAKKLGICFGLIRQTTHTGAIGRYAQWIAEQGCAAVLMGAGPTLMAYHGARVASLGTSPIAIAVPSGNGPIVLDMATSTISNGKILQGRATGTAAPGRRRAERQGRAHDRPESGGNPAPARRPQGLRVGADVRAAWRACSPRRRFRRARSVRKSARATPAIPRCSSSTSRRSGRSPISPTIPTRLSRSSRRCRGRQALTRFCCRASAGNRTEIARRKSGIPIPPKLWEELEGVAKAAAIKMPALLCTPA